MRADLGEAARPTAVKAIDEGPRSPPVPVVDERLVPATVAATVSTVARLQVLVKSARGLSKLIPEQKAVGVTLWKSASGRPKKLRVPIWRRLCADQGKGRAAQQATFGVGGPVGEPMRAGRWSRS